MRADVLAWVRDCWKPLLKLVPKVLSLVNGWFMFQFMMVEDCDIIAAQY